MVIDMKLSSCLSASPWSPSMASFNLYFGGNGGTMASPSSPMVGGWFPLDNPKSTRDSIDFSVSSKFNQRVEIPGLFSLIQSQPNRLNKVILPVREMKCCPGLQGSSMRSRWVPGSYKLEWVCVCSSLHRCFPTLHALKTSSPPLQMNANIKLYTIHRVASRWFIH